MKAKIGIRSDLACESTPQDGKEVTGVELREHRVGRLRVLRMQIQTSEAAETLGRPCGQYVTVESERLDGLTAQDRTLLEGVLAGELRGMSERLTGKRPERGLSVLVVGLGNDELTPDAIGPRTVRRLLTTRHLAKYENALFRSLGCASLSAMAPGVLGQTGIEASELVCGAVRAVCPDLVVALDALAARSCRRLAATVQLSDVGIEPGSGVGNYRVALSRETLGVPVLAVGVPTVVDSGTLVRDALAEAGLPEDSMALERVLERGRSFFVSPGDCDVVTREVSRLLSAAIGRAFLGELQGSEA